MIHLEQGREYCQGRKSCTLGQLVHIFLPMAKRHRQIIEDIILVWFIEKMEAYLNMWILMSFDLMKMVQI